MSRNDKKILWVSEDCHRLIKTKASANGKTITRYLEDELRKIDENTTKMFKGGGKLWEKLV